MRAAVLHATGSGFAIEDVSIDTPAADEVLVRIAASSLCHSDYNYVTGDMPFPLPAVLGHEVAGIVEAVGEDVRGLKVGDHVASCASLFCGHCLPCVSGRNHLCSDRPKRAKGGAPRLSLNGRKLSQGGSLGGFAEQMLVHENSLVRVDRALPLDKAALLGCAVLTGLGVVFNAAKVTAGSRVAVLGCGGVGLNVIQGARIAGAEQIIAVDLVEEKRELALKLGATHAIGGGPDLVDQVRALSNGGVDFSFEVIGRPETMTQAVRMLASGGLMTMVGVARFDASVEIPAVEMLTREWRMQGSLMGSSPFTRDIPRFGDLYLRGKLDLDMLVAEHIGLDDINSGYDVMKKGSQTRSVITFPEVLKQAQA